MPEAMLHARIPAAQPITRWAFDPQAGRISGHDALGQVRLAIPADPLFGPRLATAFDRRMQPAPYGLPH